MAASVFSDSRYAALASRVAGELGAGAQVARAILAQFACEKAGEWPPQDNNPGNVHVSAMASVGVTGLPHGIGDGGACASFPTPEAGADAMATLLLRASRYTGAVAAARANDGGGYLRAVTSAGWGTSYSCAAGYYGAGPSSSGPSAASSTLAATPAPAASSSPTSDPCQGVAPLSPPAGIGYFWTPGGDASTFPIPRARLSDPCACPPGYNRGQIDPGPLFNLPFTNNYVPLSGLGANEANACVKADLGPGSVEGQLANKAASQAGDALTAGIATALGALPGAFGSVFGSLLVNGVVLLAIVVMAYQGMRLLLEPAPSGS